MTDRWMQKSQNALALTVRPSLASGSKQGHVTACARGGRCSPADSGVVSAAVGFQPPQALSFSRIFHEQINSPGVMTW